jgi:hypothetical protein
VAGASFYCWTCYLAIDCKIERVSGGAGDGSEEVVVADYGRGGAAAIGLALPSSSEEQMET